MKVKVLGCGSIGRRHIRNLDSLGVDEILCHDSDPGAMMRAAEDVPRVRRCASVEGFWAEETEAVIIATPTHLHAADALRALGDGAHVFVEKPLSDELASADRLVDAAEASGATTMVGCNLRFFWPIATLHRLLGDGAIGRPVHARIEQGQYLPDWRPDSDYRSSYSARREQGGGVVLDAIHEFDYAMWMFGKPTDVMGCTRRLGDLDLNVEDLSEAILVYEDGPVVSVHVDYLQRAYARSCKIVGTEGTLRWMYESPGVVEVYRAGSDQWESLEAVDAVDPNDMYIAEMEHFLKCAADGGQTVNPLRAARDVLAVALLARDGS